ncbi:MAG: SGNH/GDSL hydrolase family protein [Lachnospiraceae bacterium]|nr:SGNH/GDSL hydrolase family protein [Lachnospiraceae bacterium]
MELGNAVRGPKAPKDPTKKRAVVYFMLDDAVEGRPLGPNVFGEVHYLEGRVTAKVASLLPELDSEIAKKLQLCDGFRELVHSIGVTMISDEKEHRGESISFALQCRTATGYNGTRYTMQVPCNGTEAVLELEDYEVVEGETSLASINLDFPSYFTGKMTIRFYLKDGIAVPELIPDPPVAFDSDAYRNMILKSLWQVGNTYRMKRVIEKARNGEDVTIAYIGGSITQGAGAKPIATGCYAYRSYEAFKKRFAKGKGEHVHYVKAGVGGTPSELGLTRYEDDVLRCGSVTPDVVIVEFAVNDAGDETNGVCYESLVLKAMEGPGKPAVIFLFSVFMDDYNLQDNLSRVGICYDLPMVSIKNAVTPQFYEETPVITKRQFFYDLYHPTNEGHRIMADCLDVYFAAADEAESSETDVDLEKEPAIGNRYRSLKAFGKDDVIDHEAVSFLDAGSFTETDTALQCVEKDLDAFVSPEYPDHWMHMAGCKAESFRMRIACKDLMLVYKDSGDPSFGCVDVYVDGVLTRSINPLEVGWNHCNAVIVYQGEKSAVHDVEIRLNPEDGSKNFTILGFGYTE